MKAEHRKELATNTLANTLGQAIQGMKEGPSRGTVVFLVVVGIALALGFIWVWVSRNREETDSARWLRWDSLSSPEQLKSFAEDKDVADSLPGKLARFEEARRYLLEGLRDFGSSHTPAVESLKKAAAAYDKLVDECGDRPLLHQQALMGAAKAHESLGEIDPARKFYQQLAQTYSSTVLGREAGDQLKRLEAAEQNGDLEALRKQYAPSSTPSP
jgi:tetratricopeptide (TPR) repeat protein